MSKAASLAPQGGHSFMDQADQRRAAVAVGAAGTAGAVDVGTGAGGASRGGSTSVPVPGTGGRVPSGLDTGMALPPCSAAAAGAGVLKLAGVPTIGVPGGGGGGRIACFTATAVRSASDNGTAEVPWLGALHPDRWRRRWQQHRPTRRWPRR